MKHAAASPIGSEGYESIFAKRGREYNHAMTQYPRARAEEFLAAINALNPITGETIIDAPAGGGYLSSFLPPELGLNILEVDPAVEFRQDQGARKRGRNPNDSRVYIAPLTNIPVIDNTADALVSIAGLHHAESLGAVFSEFARVLKPQGRVVILEVETDSIVDRFLNGFVNANNPDGHKGRFVDEGFRAELANAGFTITEDRSLKYHWNFRDSRAMSRFASLMFGLDLADYDEIVAGISETLGFEENEIGCRMNWGLRLLSAESGS
ncbi:MAG: class I SAM-dependent methyltransferase [Pseudomonadota bacterium]